MATPDQGAIDTFMNITGASQGVAIQKLEEHSGDLNAAINAHFSEGDRSIRPEVPGSVAPPSEVDPMDIDVLNPTEFRRPPFPLLSSTVSSNPFSLLEPNITRSIFGTDLGSTRTAPLVSHPREVREIPIEVKDGDGHSSHSGRAPAIEDVTDTEYHGPEIHGTVMIDDEEDETSNVPLAGDDIFSDARHRPSAPGFNVLSDSYDDIEEEMIRAAIEASKVDAEMSNNPIDVSSGSRDDDDLAQAVLLSLKAAEQQKAKSEVEGKGISGPGKPSSSSRRLVRRSSYIDDDDDDDEDYTEDKEAQPLVGRRSKRASSSSIRTHRNEDNVVTPVSSPGHDLPHNGTNDEWGGISSEEHDEAVMLEAAMFGGVPEGTGFRPRNWQAPRPPSPTLVAQRLLREQQDDEYLAALQADKEKELRAKQEAEAALVEEKEKEEMEREIAAKESSLPPEPSPSDENAVNLVVRMPDGSRRGRRFLKSDKLQCLFDFIDVGRVVKPGTYRLVRPYPRRAYGREENGSSLSEVGLTSKQEALYLELI